MAKSDQQEARQSARNTSVQAQSDLAPVIQGQQQQQQVAQQRQGEQYNAATGNYNDAASGYKNFATNGGFTPEEENRYVNQATSGVTNTGNVLENQARLNRSKTGGGGTGGEVAQIARQLTQSQADAGNQAKVSLNTMKNSNKLAGLGGQANVAAGQSALFNTETGEVSDMGHQVLQSLGLKYNTEEDANRILAGLSNTPGILDNITRIGGMAAGGLGALSGILK